MHSLETLAASSLLAVAFTNYSFVGMWLTYSINTHKAYFQTSRTFCLNARLLATFSCTGFTSFTLFAIWSFYLIPKQLNQSKGLWGATVSVGLTAILITLLVNFASAIAVPGLHSPIVDTVLRILGFRKTSNVGEILWVRFHFCSLLQLPKERGHQQTPLKTFCQPLLSTSNCRRCFLCLWRA